MTEEERLEHALRALENRIEMYRKHVEWPALLESLRREAEAIRDMLTIAKNHK